MTNAELDEAYVRQCNGTGRGYKTPGELGREHLLLYDSGRMSTGSPALWRAT